jgi:hypothetical protein
MISVGKRWRRYRAGSTGAVGSYMAPSVVNLSTPWEEQATRPLEGRTKGGTLTVIAVSVERLGDAARSCSRRAAQWVAPPVVVDDTRGDAMARAIQTTALFVRSPPGSRSGESLAVGWTRPHAAEDPGKKRYSRPNVAFRSVR